MLEFRSVLVPFDFSDFSEGALSYACHTAVPFQAELHILNVQEDTKAALTSPELGIIPLQDLLQQQFEAAQQTIQNFPGEEWKGRLSVTRKVQCGSPFLEIIRYARDKKIDLIVMGTHGRTGLDHVLMGSVAEKVIRKAPCPVLTVRHPDFEYIPPLQDTREELTASE